MQRQLIPLLLSAALVLGWYQELTADEAPTGAVQLSSCRANGPPPVACYAVPSDTGHAVGYYVGGGCLCLGDLRRPEDGTWGWDYAGCLLSKYVVLQWCHCRRCQNGVGAYRIWGANCTSLSSP